MAINFWDDLIPEKEQPKNFWDDVIPTPSLQVEPLNLQTTQQPVSTVDTSDILIGQKEQIPLSWTPPTEEKKVEDKKPYETSLRLPPKKNLLQKITEPIERLYQPSKEKSANIYAISQATGVDVNTVEKNYTKIIEDIGIQEQPSLPQTLKRGAELGATGLVVSGLISNPVSTLTGIATFLGTKEVSERAVLPAAKMAYNKLLSREVQYEVTKLRDLVPGDYFKDTADVAEFVIYGTVAGKVLMGLKTVSPKIKGEINGLRYRIGRMMGKKFETSVVPLEKTFPTGPSGVATLPESSNIIPGTGIKKPELIEPRELRPLQRLAEREEIVLKGENEFLSAKRKRLGILDYFFKPGDRQLNESGLGRLGVVTRDAMQNKRIEIQAKQSFLNNAKEELAQDLVRRGNYSKKQMNVELAKVRNYLEEGGIPEHPVTPAQRFAKAMRFETKAMLSRVNQVRREAGQPEAHNVKDYLLHMVKDEILHDITSNGEISSDTASILNYIPNKNVFLKTALERTDVPDSWLVKDPLKLMDYMYKIDLKYTYLQDAMTRIAPYTKYLEGTNPTPVPKGKSGFDASVLNYWNDYANFALKGKPSSFDNLLNNSFDAIIGMALNRLPKVRGKLHLSNRPYEQSVNFILAATYSGALGARIKPCIRNLTQGSFDSVMYGVNAHMKGAQKALTSEGKAVLNQSKIWRTRVPYEAGEQTIGHKILSAGSVPYKMSDQINVANALLTRYYYATDKLGYGHKKALNFADTDLPNTQWSYLREDMPRAFWTTTGRAVNALGSWWMNYYYRFLPEIVSRTFKGVDISGRRVESVERLAGLRFIGLVGSLYGMKSATHELFGNPIDYTSQVTPSPFGASPLIQSIENMKQFTQGMAEKNVSKMNKSMLLLARSAKVSIPFYLSIEDIYKSIENDTPEDLFFYNKRFK